MLYTHTAKRLRNDCHINLANHGDNSSNKTDEYTHVQSHALQHPTHQTTVLHIRLHPQFQYRTHNIQAYSLLKQHTNKNATKPPHIPRPIKTSHADFNIIKYMKPQYVDMTQSTMEVDHLNIETEDYNHPVITTVTARDEPTNLGYGDFYIEWNLETIEGTPILTSDLSLDPIEINEDCQVEGSKSDRMAIYEFYTKVRSEIESHDGVAFFRDDAPSRIVIETNADRMKYLKGSPYTDIWENIQSDIWTAEDLEETATNTDYTVIGKSREEDEESDRITYHLKSNTNRMYAITLAVNEETGVLFSVQFPHSTLTKSITINFDTTIATLFKTLFDSGELTKVKTLENQKLNLKETVN